MKKNVIIAVAALVLGAGGYYAWQHYFCSGGSCEQAAACHYSESRSCAMKQGGHHDGEKASMMCERACGIKDYKAEDLVPNSMAKPGDLTKCPVSEAAFVVEEGSETFSFEGKNYYSCCETCTKVFNRSPETYKAYLN